MNWIDFLGYAASASVLITFCMSTMLPLRIVAIAGNVLFATLSAEAFGRPQVTLHAHRYGRRLESTVMVVTDDTARIVS